LTLEGILTATGTYRFDDVELPTSRIFIAELAFDGMNLQSGFAIVKEGDSSLSLPPITLHNKTEDTSRLVIDEARIFFEYGTDNVQVFNVYSFRNPSDEIIVVSLNENSEVSFMKPPQAHPGLVMNPCRIVKTSSRLRTALPYHPARVPMEWLRSRPCPEQKKWNFHRSLFYPSRL
jgi:hypothetical protein